MLRRRSLGNVDRNIILDELQNELPADSARCGKPIWVIGYHSTRRILLLALADTLGQGTTLRTIAWSESYVLDVAARVDPAALRTEGCSHFEFAVGRIGTSTGRKSRL